MARRRIIAWPFCPQQHCSHQRAGAASDRAEQREFAARDKLPQVDDPGAFDIKCLQLLCAERDELAALILVSLDDLLLLNLLAGAGIMRPEGNPSCLASVTCLVAAVIEGEPGCRFGTSCAQPDQAPRLL